MGKGKRYNGAEHKLNIKKVIAVIIALLVIIMFAVIISKLLKYIFFAWASNNRSSFTDLFLHSLIIDSISIILSSKGNSFLL